MRCERQDAACDSWQQRGKPLHALRASRIRAGRQYNFASRETPRQAWRAVDASGAVHARTDRGRGLICGGHAQQRIADSKKLTGPHRRAIGVDGDAVKQCAIHRSEIAHCDASRRNSDRGMLARDVGIGQGDVTRWRAADRDHAARQRGDQSRVRTADDMDAQDRAGREVAIASERDVDDVAGPQPWPA